MAKKRSDEELVGALAALDYNVYERAETELSESLAKKPDVDRLIRLANLSLTKPFEDSRERLGYIVLPLLAAELDSNKWLPAKYDKMVTAYGVPDQHRLVLSKIPEARRLAIFEREIWKGDKNGAPRMVDAELDLAPEAAKVALDYFDSRGELEWAVSWIYLTKWRSTIPRVDHLLKEAAKRTPLPVPPEEPVLDFKFQDKSAIEPKAFRKLDDVTKAQYLISASAFLGLQVRDSAHFVRALKTEKRTKASDAVVSKWKVMLAGKHVYDYFSIGEYGIFFKAKKTKRIAVDGHSGFCRPRDPKLNSLSEALDKARRRDTYKV